MQFILAKTCFKKMPLQIPPFNSESSLEIEIWDLEKY